MPRLDPDIIRKQIAQLLLQCPELEDDQVLKADMLEAETDLHPFLSQVTLMIQEREGLADTSEQYAKTITERAKRYRHSADGLRDMALRTMQAAGEKSITLPGETLIVGTGKRKVIITDEQLLPADCKRTKTSTEPDKATIGAKLARGEHVNGAVLSNAEPYLTIRPK